MKRARKTEQSYHSRSIMIGLRMIGLLKYPKAPSHLWLGHPVGEKGMLVRSCVCPPGFMAICPRFARALRTCLGLSACPRQSVPKFDRKFACCGLAAALLSRPSLHCNTCIDTVDTHEPTSFGPHNMALKTSPFTESRHCKRCFSSTNTCVQGLRFASKRKR